MNPVPPAPEEQVLFLRNVQRLLSEGLFTASYKLGLLHAIADLCVVKGDDSGGQLDLDLDHLAEKFVELYWQQCRPFQFSGQVSGFVLLQNKGKQAAIIRKIARAQDEHGGSLFRLRQSAPDLWGTLIAGIRRTVLHMPLWKLQTVGSERLDFLYENIDAPTKSITLKPGIAFCFRAYYPLLRDLIQGAWVRFVQRVNSTELGAVTDLGSFLFDQERSSLESYRKILVDVQSNRCLYCHREIRGKSDIDHFVPWTRYPTDLGHNFVLAHPSCNNSKSDFLAAEQHLGGWAERNRNHAHELEERLTAAGLLHDQHASTRIAEWAYEQVEKANGQVWVGRASFQHLGQNWRQLFAA